MRLFQRIGDDGLHIAPDLVWIVLDSAGQRVMVVVILLGVFPDKAVALFKDLNANPDPIWQAAVTPPPQPEASAPPAEKSMVSAPAAQAPKS